MSRTRVAPGRRFKVVGIGASAGGLEAVSRLLSHLPADTGMAFVVVQHMDPQRESLLPVILQKTTTMHVLQAKDGSVVAPNRVYVIPPNTHMIVKGGALRLIAAPARATSVNCFLDSLAEECGGKAIAVILSGTANDGSLGIAAVKAAGGVVFAQDKQSAQHFGMPQSAAATGVVDFILPPEKIAAELTAIALRPAGAGADPLEQIFMLLRRATGVDFSHYKPTTIKRRLLRRMALRKIGSLEQYKLFLDKTPDELRSLHDDMLIHVTRFYREPKTMAALRAKAFPRILKGLPPGAPIRVWVPGCSTGEEAYSLAIELLDYLGERDCTNPIQIFATDLSDVALERARLGVYSEEVRGHVSPRLLRRFFVKVDRGYEVVKRVRDACVFARQDLTKDPPFAKVDLISCCNVLIYLGPKIQTEILPMFHRALRPSGAMILGSAETVGRFEDLFAPADKKCRLYYKRPSARTQYTLRDSREDARPPEADVKTKTISPLVATEADVQKVAERLLLARYAPACVYIGGDLRVLHFQGRVSRYLQPFTGKADLNLLKMVPAPIAGTLNSLITRARRSDSSAKESGIDLEGDDGRRMKIAIEVVAFHHPISEERYFIVIFEDGASSAAEDKALRAEPARAPEPGAVKRLQGELVSTRAYLHTIVAEHEGVNEELRAANEEIIANNEELQSTNEELGVAKEELQATNEELSTVNEELQTRNLDLGSVNNDLLNLISSVHLPIIMVSNDLRIRRFSKMAEKIMNLIPGDIGRPIGDIKAAVALPNIEEIIHEVIETVTTKELEVRDKDKHSYAVRIRPYKTTENKIDGAVIVFMDNDPIKRSISEVKDVSAFEAILDMSGEPLAILDAEMRVKAGSRSLYQAFGLTESSVGMSLFEIEGGRWNVKALRLRLQRLAAEGEPFSKISIRIDDRTCVFSARRVKSADEGPPLILLSINSVKSAAR
jgi:two-component system CheB/CheR fusion protein